MSKHKSAGKDKKKGSQFVIRVDKAERDAFVSLCDKLDTSAAREIRRFMRETVAAHAVAEATPDAAVVTETAVLTADEDIAAEVGPEIAPPLVEAEKKRRNRKNPVA
jgi:hypothetical protein